MAWSNSKIFRFFVGQVYANAAAYDLSGAGVDSFKAALYNNSITPDQNVTTDVLTGYNGAASQWVTGNEVTDATNWPAGGRPLVSPAIDATTSNGVVFFDAADTASVGATTTLASVFGTLVYDDTLTNKPGISYNYFGGTQSVTNGTFTIIWHANGIFRWTF
jgi:hypothetical protein